MISVTVMMAKAPTASGLGGSTTSAGMAVPRNSSASRWRVNPEWFDRRTSLTCFPPGSITTSSPQIPSVSSASDASMVQVGGHQDLLPLGPEQTCKEEDGGRSQV